MPHTTRPIAKAAAILSAAVFISGCGCFYGTASEVEVSPAQDCLEVSAYAHCAWLGLLGTNGCDEPLTLLPVEDVEPVEVLPGDSFELDDVTPYADMLTDDAYCSTDAVVHAELGDATLTLSFDVDRVNRGLRLPCE